ncbi:MAG: hypothetical protein KJP23_12730, partial [Deltaproteobacteria bacterium]|nr:hypothetical protein [Deltaproteobacteria bacterium]
MSDKIVRLLPQFIYDINLIQPEFSFSDRVWQFALRIGPEPKDWTMVHVTLYENTYYCHWTEWDLTLELSMKGKIKKPSYLGLNDGDSNKFAFMLTGFRTVAKRITKDWLRVYRETLKNLPLDMRYGILSKGVIWKYYSDWYRADVALGKRKTARFAAHVRAGKFRSDYAGHHREMSLALYMKYCKVAYTANFRNLKGAIEKGMSGLEMYNRLADGRHEGLVELPLESADAFKQWYHSGRGGGHPWEVYRGGNTTHIDLGVTEKASSWSVFLRGSSTSRMAETIRIALALEKEGLPVEIHDAEELRSRLLGMDNMGIIPKFIINHRASQNFEKEDRVHDCAPMILAGKIGYYRLSVGSPSSLSAQEWYDTVTISTV